MSNPDQPQIPTKTCSDCGAEKPLSEFSVRSSRTLDTRLASRCKVCHASAMRQWRADHKVEVSASNRQAYLARKQA